MGLAWRREIWRVAIAALDPKTGICGFTPAHVDTLTRAVGDAIGGMGGADPGGGSDGSGRARAKKNPRERGNGSRGFLGSCCGAGLFRRHHQQVFFFVLINGVFIIKPVTIGQCRPQIRLTCAKVIFIADGVHANLA